jgi:CRP-like cAMP-binding protein
MNPDLDILGRTELLRGLAPAALAECQATAFRKRLSSGDVLLRQGEPAETLYGVIVGRLRVTQTASDGQQVIIRYPGPGELVGYATLSGGDVLPGTVTAVDDTHLVGWTAAAIREILARHPVAAMNALAVLGARYREMQVRLREVATEKVEQRIAHTIMRLADQAGRRTARGVEIAFPISRQDLAEMAGTTLHTVSRTLSGWEDRGIVTSGRRRVIVCDPQALSRIAAEE